LISNEKDLYSRSRKASPSPFQTKGGTCVRLFFVSWSSQFYITFAWSGQAGEAILDGANLSVDSPDYDAVANVFITQVDPDGTTVKVDVVLHDNKSVVFQENVLSVEGDLLLTVSDNMDVMSVAQLGGEGSYTGLVVEPGWALFKGIWAHGADNTYRFILDVDLGSGGPFFVQAMLVSEGMQPHGFSADVSRFEARDSRGFYYDGDVLEFAHSGDMAMAHAFELFDTSEGDVPLYMAMVDDGGGLPVYPPSPLRAWDNGGWIESGPPTGWDGVVDVDVCFRARPSWSAEGTGMQGDRRPLVDPLFTAWCSDGLIETPCYLEDQPMRRLRLHVYEETTAFTQTSALHIPDGYVNGPGAVYTDEDGCARLWISWNLVQQDFPEVANDDYPDLFVVAYYEGGHPSLAGGSPETEEPIFEVAAAFLDPLNPPDGTYVDHVGVSTPTMNSLGHTGGYFGGDGHGTETFWLNDEINDIADNPINPRSNLFLVATESFQVAYDQGVTQAFWCTTEFPGDPNNACADDRLAIAYDYSTNEGSRYRRTGPDGSFSKLQGPLIYTGTDKGFVNHTLGHEIGHHVHNMAYLREVFSISYASELNPQSTLSTIFDCTKNNADKHLDYCPEFEATATVEAWADFWGGVTWFDSDAQQPVYGDTVNGGSAPFNKYRLDQWPLDGTLAPCMNPLQQTLGGAPIGELTVSNVEGLVRQLWWDLYDLDDGVAGTTESLHEPGQALRFVDGYDQWGNATVYEVPRDQVFLHLYEMVDAWEALALSQHGLNGSVSEVAFIGLQEVEPLEGIPEWWDWAPVQPWEFYEEDPDSPNMNDWLEGLYWVLGDTPDLSLATGFLMESGCLYTFSRN